MEISGKIGSQRHLVAIRDSFIAMMPITRAWISYLINFPSSIILVLWFTWTQCIGSSNGWYLWRGVKRKYCGI